MTNPITAAPSRPPGNPTSPLTHFDRQGQAHMVDVSGKAPTHRTAIATGHITMQPATLALIENGTAQKGDVLGIARIAAIMAAKKTSDLIPLCHPLALTRVAVAFETHPTATATAVTTGAGAPLGAEAASPSSPCAQVTCTVQVETQGPTGVEMEALTAVQIALLTIYDMCKAADKAMVIGGVRLLEKRGGKSQAYSAIVASG